MEIFTPANTDQVQEIVASAATAVQRLEISGGGSKRGLGRPVEADAVIDLSRISGIVDYEPSELILTARAATPMAEITKLLEDSQQMLAFEPANWQPLGVNGATLGGVLACNISGPRRVRAGAARDHFLGFTAVNGRGEIWKAGGKVVKNVTGYDMSKLQCGAFGTLSILTEVTMKVMPQPETSRSLVAFGLTDEDAIPRLAQALNTPFEVSAAAHLPAAAARLAGYDAAITLFRVEGPAPSVTFRAQELTRLLSTETTLEEATSLALWREIGTAALLPAGCVWRLCPTPSQAPQMVRTIRKSLTSAQVFYDWGGGLVWLSLDAQEAGADAGSAIIRTALRTAGGHATLIAAAPEIRGTMQVFEPEPAPLAALTQRIKRGFDPCGILNPGRMREGV